MERLKTGWKLIKAIMERDKNMKSYHGLVDTQAHTNDVTLYVSGCWLHNHTHVLQYVLYKSKYLNLLLYVNWCRQWQSTANTTVFKWRNYCNKRGLFCSCWCGIFYLFFYIELNSVRPTWLFCYFCQCC